MGGERELIDPAKMPLTRLANAVIDGVAEAPGPVAADIEKYLASDLLFYRASSPQDLRERQAQHWDPIVAWARDDLGARFQVGEGIVYVAQPERALKAAAAAIPADPWRLGAVHVVTTLTGSALIALAMSHAQIVGRCGMAGGPCRRGLEYGAMGHATRWRSNAVRSTSPNCRRRRRCSVYCRAKQRAALVAPKFRP